MTKIRGVLERAVIISSVIPSLKYSCFGSSLILAKGSTAIEGLSGRGNAIFFGSAFSTARCEGRQINCHRAAAAMITITIATMVRYFRFLLSTLVLTLA